MTRIETELPLNWQSELHNQLKRFGPLKVAGDTWSSQHLIEILRPMVEDRRWSRIQKVVSGRTWDLMTITEQLYDIGNLSAVMRSAESFGFLPFYILNRQGSVYKKSDRISKGSEKWLHLERGFSLPDCVKSVREKGYRILVTSLDDSQPIEDVDFTQPTALVFGNERDGVSEAMRNMADGAIRIPMLGFAQSFNISVAAALCYQQAHLQRKAKLGSDHCQLSEEEKRTLEAQYLMRSLGSEEKVASILRKASG